jgi:hypothetical protein
MKKQNLEWYSQLTGNHYDSLVNQLTLEILGQKTSCLSDALNAFCWKNTTEGYEYWKTQFERACNLEGHPIPSDPFESVKRSFPKEKTPIGFKAPHDLFRGRIKKGSIFSLFSPKKLVMYTPSAPSSGVPTEIVETWEPVYEEKEELVVGRPEVCVTISKGRIEAKGIKVSPFGIQVIHSEMNSRKDLLPWPVSYSTVAIGCSLFSKEDINKIWETYSKLNQ